MICRPASSMCRRFFRTTMRKRSCRSERVLLTIATSSLARTSARLGALPALQSINYRSTLHVTCGQRLSILPAVWSFQLALRARGLGSTFTTLHLRRGDEAAELLGIPANLMQVGPVPVAFTIGTDFKPAQRPPLEDITHWEQW